MTKKKTFVHLKDTFNPELTCGLCEQPLDVSMKLRDWFAGMAMRGCLWDDDMEHNHRTVALCYQIADAMLRAREEDSE